MNIKKISQLTGISSYTLRYYEKIGLLINIERDSKNHRAYSEKDVIWIGFIKRLKATNMPLNEMKKFASLRSKGDSTINKRVKILKKHHVRVNEQIKNLKINKKKIKEKIEICKKSGEIRSP